MSLPSSIGRVLLATTLAAALLAGSGCRLMHRQDGSTRFLPRSHNADYKKSKENRPLEVPPDLDTPATDPAMQIPRGGSTFGSSAPAGPSVSTGFVVSDTPAGAWERMGKALDRIGGVTVTQRTQLLNSYEVQFKGATLLIRANPEGGATHVDAVGADGQPVRTPEAQELLNLLKDRIG